MRDDFADNGTYNIFAMARSAKANPNPAPYYEIAHHQPCGDGKEDEPEKQMAVDFRVAIEGSEWKRRDGRKAIFKGRGKLKQWPVLLAVSFMPTYHTTTEVTLEGRAGIDPSIDHEGDIIGPWDETP